MHPFSAINSQPILMAGTYQRAVVSDTNHFFPEIKRSASTVDAIIRVLLGVVLA